MFIKITILRNVMPFTLVVLSIYQITRVTSHNMVFFFKKNYQLFPPTESTSWAVMLTADREVC
jgi:hypothetical protein